MPRAGDVAAVALVLLADVEHGDAVGEQMLELLDLDTAQRLGGRRVDDVAGEIEEADRVQAGRRPRRLAVGASVDRNACLGREHEAGLGREARTRHRDIERAVHVSGGRRVARPDVEDDGIRRQSV